MKFSRKLMMISAAAIMGFAPVTAAAVSNRPVLAAKKHKGVHNTYGKKSRVKTIKSVHFVNVNGKKQKRVARKGGSYVIWNVKTIKGHVYLSIQTNLKLWLPASAVTGHVQYRQGGKTIKLNIKKGKVRQTVTVIKYSKKTRKNRRKKASTKRVKKNSRKAVKRAKRYHVMRIKTIRRTHVVNAKGQNVKSYMGSKKYAVIGKNINLRGFGTKIINGKKYYALTPKKYYVAAKDVKTR